MTQVLESFEIVSSRITAEEVDGFEKEMAWINLEVTRIGVGHGPIETRSTILDGARIDSVFIGYPVLTLGEFSENQITVAVMRSVPAGARVCGVDIQPGTVLYFGPGARHTGRFPENFGYSLVTIDLSRMEEAANRLDLRLSLPAEGHVRVFRPSATTDNLVEVVGLIEALDHDGVHQDSRALPVTHCLDALCVTAAALSTEFPSKVIGAGPRIDDRDIVHVCVGYIGLIGRAPSIPDFCLVAHVSQRRLRSAFTESFGMPPTKYFTYRSMTKARRRLLSGRTPRVNVSRTSADFGFNNMGRFARHYKETFSELPSETLSKVASRSSGSHRT